MKITKVPKMYVLADFTVSVWPRNFGRHVDVLFFQKRAGRF